MKAGLISASSSLSLIASDKRSPRMTVLGISRHFAYLGTQPIVTCALSEASNDSPTERNGSRSRSAVGVIVSLIYLGGGPRCKPVHNRRVVREYYEFASFLHSFEW